MDTGTSGTLIPLEVMSALALPLLGGPAPVVGIGGASTMGLPCHLYMHFGEMNVNYIEAIACDSAWLDGENRMIIAGSSKTQRG